MNISMNMMDSNPIEDPAEEKAAKRYKTLRKRHIKCEEENDRLEIQKDEYLEKLKCHRSLIHKYRENNKELTKLSWAFLEIYTSKLRSVAIDLEKNRKSFDKLTKKVRDLEDRYGFYIPGDKDETN